jgi:hypothetical protein
LKLGESFALEISEEMISRFRAIVRVSGRTSRWHWSVRQTSERTYQVKKVGLWNSRLS